MNKITREGERKFSSADRERERERDGESARAGVSFVTAKRERVWDESNESNPRLLRLGCLCAKKKRSEKRGAFESGYLNCRRPCDLGKSRDGCARIHVYIRVRIQRVRVKGR